jgi:hypothetical protein
MLQQILNDIIPVLITAIIAILVAIIKKAGDAVVAWLGKKKEAEGVKIGINTYNQNLAFAKAAWNIVEEFFRINPLVQKTVDSTWSMFATEMKKFVPTLTDDEINQLRQAIAGEVNAGKAVVTAPVEPAVVEPAVVEPAVAVN